MPTIHTKHNDPILMPNIHTKYKDPTLRLILIFDTNTKHLLCTSPRGVFQTPWAQGGPQRDTRDLWHR